MVSTHEDVGNKDAVELALLKQLGKLDPVADVVKVPGAVIRMSPEARRLMTTARLYKGIDDELLLGLCSHRRCFGRHGVGCGADEVQQKGHRNNFIKPRRKPSL